MREYLERKWELKSHKKGWPVYAVKTFVIVSQNVKKIADPSLPDDILSYYMAIWRPACYMLLTGDLEGIIRFGKVVYQCVQPNIYRLRLVIRDRNPPAQSFCRP